MNLRNGSQVWSSIIARYLCARKEYITPLYVLLNPDPEPQLNQNGVRGWDASKKKYYKKNELIKKYEQFIAANGIEIAGIEYIIDKKDEVYTYDVNTNTNYNSQAEKSSEIKGMKSIAAFLKEELLLLSNIKVVA